MQLTLFKPLRIILLGLLLILLGCKAPLNEKKAVTLHSQSGNKPDEQIK